MASLAKDQQRPEAQSIRIGSLTVDPSTRRVHGPGGERSIEPRVLQVLLLLVRANGQVVTRKELIDRCWDGQVVGDDAINRTIAEVRRIARTVATDSFHIETITKSGYRLILAEPDEGPVETVTSLISRRNLLVGAAALVGAGATISAWRALPSGDERQATQLLQQARQALRDGLPDAAAKGVGFLKEAVRLTPDNAEAWGLLAYAWREVAEFGNPRQVQQAVQECEMAAGRALEREPAQPDAQLALATLTPSFGDWPRTWTALSKLADANRGHAATLAALGVLASEVGRQRDNYPLIQQAAELDPLSPVYQFRRVYGHWNMAELDQMDRVADRALQLWPRHMAVWMVRFYTLAFTGRPQLAAAMWEDRANWPAGLDLIEPDMFPSAARALASRAPSDIGVAVRATLKAASISSFGAVSGIMFMSALGQIDTAFDLANAYLLRSGPMAVPVQHRPGAPSVNDHRRRKTQMLFVPVTAPLRGDPRFSRLCDGIGLTNFWASSNLVPDFQSRPVPLR